MAFFVAFPLNLHREDLFYSAQLVTEESFGRSEVHPRVGAELGGGLFLTVIQPVNLWPFGPRIVWRAFEGRAGQDFELDEAAALVAHCSADAIGPGVAAADDHHILGFRGNEAAI